MCMRKRLRSQYQPWGLSVSVILTIITFLLPLATGGPCTFILLGSDSMNCICTITVGFKDGSMHSQTNENAFHRYRHINQESNCPGKKVITKNVVLVEWNNSYMVQEDLLVSRPTLPLGSKSTEPPVQFIHEASSPASFEWRILDRLRSAIVASMLPKGLKPTPSLVVLTPEGPSFPLEVPIFLHLSLREFLPGPPRNADVGGLGSTSILHTGQVFAVLNQVYQAIEWDDESRFKKCWKLVRPRDKVDASNESNSLISAHHPPSRTEYLVRITAAKDQMTYIFQTDWTSRFVSLLSPFSILPFF